MQPKSYPTTPADWSATLTKMNLRRLPHHLESLGIAFSICMVLSVALFGFRVDSALHEWGLFLKHLETATGPAKQMVLGVMAGLYLIMLAIVVLARRNKGKAA
jgi:hypothetical protein